MEKKKQLDQVIDIRQGDITKLASDAIVNAANRSLMGGGGVDGAIHRAGGPIILQECKKIVESQGPCDTGQAVYTTAGNLPAKYVIHTVGPIWNGGDHQEKSLLADCYRNSLALARSLECRSISFPNISTGVYGFPKPEAPQIALGSVISFLQKNGGMEKVFFVCFDEENYRLMRTYFQNLNLR
jgi:O-acetyl-ADP-ribose deacetylase (regulator of RNase III)